MLLDSVIFQAYAHIIQSLIDAVQSLPFPFLRYMTLASGQIPLFIAPFQQTMQVVAWDECASPQQCVVRIGTLGNGGMRLFAQMEMGLISIFLSSHICLACCDVDTNCCVLPQGFWHSVGMTTGQPFYIPVRSIHYLSPLEPSVNDQILFMTVNDKFIYFIHNS